MKRFTYGQVVEGLTIDGRAITAPVYNENQVRAAAGITMALGAIAFSYANFEKIFGPIKLVTAFFFVDFLVRSTVGLQYSPVGVASKVLVRRLEPQWTSAKPKRFAWTLGLVMSLAMTIITNSNIHGALPRTICLICLALMWMEAVLSLCLGCELYGFLARRGWIDFDPEIEICAGGACNIADRHREKASETEHVVA